MTFWWKNKGIIQQFSALPQLCGQGVQKKHEHSVYSALCASTSWLLGFQFAIDEVTNQGKIDFRPTDGAQLFEIFVKEVRICTRIALD